MLEGRLARRMRELDLTSATDYWNYLFHSPSAAAERVEFINSITTNKTDFFREPTHFDYLTNRVVPEWLARRKGGQFKLWCAGCSSGEEPYTLAMVLSEVALRIPGFDFALLATDVSTKVLEQAQSGIYDEARAEAIPEGLRKKYLLRSRDSERGQVRINTKLRRKIGFHRLNFMDSNYQVPREFDVVFFRNVLIYFDKPMQESVVCKIAKSLKPDGYLFIGHSESLAGLKVPVDSLGSAIFRKKGGSA